MKMVWITHGVDCGGGQQRGLKQGTGGWGEGVEEDGGRQGCGSLWWVDSKSYVEACWTACCDLAVNRQLTSLLGCTPSRPKKDGQFQKRLKLSMKKQSSCCKPSRKGKFLAKTPHSTAPR